MVKHYRLDMVECTAAILSGSLHHVCPPGRDNGEWFEVSYILGPEWFKPYADRLQHWTGYAGPIPAIDSPRYPGGYAENLCHTHLVTLAVMSSHGFQFSGFIHSADWNGKTAAQRFRGYFAECVSAAVGDAKREPEFFELSNGLLKRNPQYLRRHAPHPAASSAGIFGALLQWWTDSQATPGQREILARCAANHRTVCPRDELGAFLLRNYEPGYRVDWSAPLVTLEQFREA
jgi:hypothetical protein